MPVERGFLDTNILVYAQLTDDPKSPVAKALRDAGGVIGIQVLNEFANVLRRKLSRPWDQTTMILAATRQLLEVVPLTEAIHEDGLRLAERYSLSIYDAMIVAAGLDSGCNVLWSEDMQHDLLVDGRLRIRNPFL